MSPPPDMRLFLLLLALGSAQALPKWNPGDKDVPLADGNAPQPEERINLHHTLKDVANTATKTVKDIHGYIHQEITAVGKKGLDIIGPPLMKIAAPMIYIRDQLDSLLTQEDPLHQEETPSSSIEPDPTHLFHPEEFRDKITSFEKSQNHLVSTTTGDNSESSEPISTEESPTSVHSMTKRKVSSNAILGNYISDPDDGHDSSTDDSADETRRESTLKSESAKRVLELLSRVSKIKMDIRLGPGQPLLLANIFRMGRPSVGDKPTELPQVDSSNEETGLSTTECLLCVLEGGKTHEYGDNQSDSSTALMSMMPRTRSDIKGH